MENTDRCGLDEVIRAKVQLGMDDEIFLCLYWGAMAQSRMLIPARFARYLDHYMMSIFDGDVAAERKRLKDQTLAFLEGEISTRRLPLRRTLNHLAKREFGVDEAAWLNCGQLARLAYYFKKDAASREETE